MSSLVAQSGLLRDASSAQTAANVASVRSGHLSSFLGGPKAGFVETAHCRKQLGLCPVGFCWFPGKELVRINQRRARTGQLRCWVEVLSASYFHVKFQFCEGVHTCMKSWWAAAAVAVCVCERIGGRRGRTRSFWGFLAAVTVQMFTGFKPSSCQCVKQGGESVCVQLWCVRCFCLVCESGRRVSVFFCACVCVTADDGWAGRTEQGTMNEVTDRDG